MSSRRAPLTLTAVCQQADPPMALPFATRFNLACTALASVFDWVSLAIVLAYWLRNGATSDTGMHIFLVLEALLSVLPLVWRWRCRRAPHLGSYGRWRELAAVAARANEALLGGLVVRWPVLWLSQVKGAEDGGEQSYWADTLRHAVLLLSGSGSLAHLVTWSKPMRIWLALPVHLCLSIALASTSRGVCQSACMSSPAAEQLTRRAYGVLNTVRLDVFRAAGMPALTPRSECAVVLTHLQLVVGFLLPALVHLSLETRLFLQYQTERQRAGLPLQNDRQAAAYAAVASLFEVLFWPQALLALGMLLSIAFDMSQLAA